MLYSSIRCICMRCPGYLECDRPLSNSDLSAQHILSCSPVPLADILASSPGQAVHGRHCNNIWQHALFRFWNASRSSKDLFCGSMCRLRVRYTRGSSSPERAQRLYKRSNNLPVCYNTQTDGLQFGTQEAQGKMAEQESASSKLDVGTGAGAAPYLP